jgi:hypothetical protein
MFLLYDQITGNWTICSERKVGDKFFSELLVCPMIFHFAYCNSIKYIKLMMSNRGIKLTMSYAKKSTGIVLLQKLDFLRGMREMN